MKRFSPCAFDLECHAMFKAGADTNEIASKMRRMWLDPDIREADVYNAMSRVRDRDWLLRERRRAS